MVEDHAHCLVCGKVISPGRKFCSSKCEEKYLERKASLERSRRMINILMLLTPVLLVIYIVIVRLWGV